MRHKYCDYYYSIRKTKDGYVWTIWNKEGEKMQSSLDNEDKEDQYLETDIAAKSDAIDAIQDYYR